MAIADGLRPAYRLGLWAYRLVPFGYRRTASPAPNRGWWAARSFGGSGSWSRVLVLVLVLDDDRRLPASGGAAQGVSCVLHSDRYFAAVRRRADQAQHAIDAIGDQSLAGWRCSRFSRAGLLDAGGCGCVKKRSPLNNLWFRPCASEPILSTHPAFPGDDRSKPASSEAEESTWAGG
jgi:hypothetical protein